MSTSAYSSYCNYGWEAVAYATEASSINKTFGRNVKISSKPKNNLEKLRDHGSKDVANVVPGKFEGNITIDFDMANCWFLRGTLGGPAVDSDDATYGYAHTWTSANGGITNALSSMTIEEGTDLTTDSIVKYLGFVANKTTIKGEIGQIVKVTLDGPYANETEGTTLGSQVAEVEDAFHFWSGSVQLPSATTLVAVQSFSLEINNDVELRWGHGSRFAVAQVSKTREYNLTLTMDFAQASDLLEKFYGSATGPSATTIAPAATCVLTFSNAGATSARRSLTITLANIYFDERDSPKNVGETIIENATGFAKTLTSAVYIDNVATSP